MRPTLHEHAAATGKVILMGEHAVVHGCPAIAAAIGQRIELAAERIPDPSAPITLQIPDWGLDETLTPDNAHPVARACLEVLAHSDGPVLGWAIRGRSDLPARAGLGSSAALTVAIAKLVAGPRVDIDSIVAASLAGESVFHGRPSGIDSHVAARGGVLRYVRGHEPQPVTFDRPIRLIVAPSGVPRNTADQVAKAGRRLERLPAAGKAVLSALAKLVARTETGLVRHDIGALGEAFDMAHHLLASLDVSHPRLDELCHLARQSGAAGAKLTGAGGGGSLIAVVDSEASEHNVLAALREAGVAAFATDITAAGSPP